MIAYNMPPVGGRWRPARDLAEEPRKPEKSKSRQSTGGKEVTEKKATKLPEGGSERAQLERSTGLPLTRLTDKEWDKVRDAATRFAQKKLHLTYNEAARHYPEYIREGYMAAIKGRKGTRGIPREPREAGLSEVHSEVPDDYGDRMMARTREFSETHKMSFNEAARYIV